MPTGCMPGGKQIGDTGIGGLMVVIWSFVNGSVKPPRKSLLPDIIWAYTADFTYDLRQEKGYMGGNPEDALGQNELFRRCGIRLFAAGGI